MDSAFMKADQNRTTVLIVGMLDSIHIARWLKQFEMQDIDFLIMASKKFRKIHPQLLALLNSNTPAKYRLGNSQSLKMIAGYLDYFNFELPLRFGFSRSRIRALERILKTREFAFVHALEIQGAGYLLDEVDSKILSDSKLIITNWGSDIYYFQRFPEHVTKIRSILSKADYYSGECLRDYALAKDFGFIGSDLPCIPNAGGFQIFERDESYVKPSKRRQILIKGYGGIFGRADLPISIISKISNNYPDINFHFYSATEDTLALIKSLPGELLSKIRVTGIRDRLTHDQMLIEFAKSRVYIGCSESDGISTSFIESLIYGAYPIQTNTSCANEWISRGAIGDIIALDFDLLLSKVQASLEDDEQVDIAAETNFKIAHKYLAMAVIQKAALKFYELAE